MTYMYDGIIITDGGSRFSVELEDKDLVFYIRKELALEIAKECNEYKHIIAVALAYIEYARSTTGTPDKKAMKKIPEEILISTFPVLWGKYQDNIIPILKNSSYPFIIEIMNSDNPLDVIEEAI